MYLTKHNTKKKKKRNFTHTRLRNEAGATTSQCGAQWGTVSTKASQRGRWGGEGGHTQKTGGNKRGKTAREKISKGVLKPSTKQRGGPKDGHKAREQTANGEITKGSPRVPRK